MSDRGIRNNNPGNLRYTDIAWKGLALPPHDADGYCVFTTALMGLRALALDLHTANVKDKKGTVRKIIAPFAPPEDHNPTPVYIANVAAALGVGPDDPVDLTVPATLMKMTVAVVHQEDSNYNYDAHLIANAVQLALGAT